ncbi:hypothetical protein EDC18_10665 [Natranaerovirga pectinivora]|uniref:Uncharacterized protein n=1 Tax=Natranaerovirga pectinivora TaxID=682400 RepID=A0A4R3MNK6_9FIRM|nr:hypothetical protein [Natranaerovirga pectinivora]TCT14269.1 hypothetical protein EDC18_10665 [Natranaerovirga pectinivora]
MLKAISYINKNNRQIKMEDLTPIDKKTVIYKLNKKGIEAYGYKVKEEEI